MENILGRSHVINHEHIPAACFTHPEIAMVGLTEEQAKARAAEQGFPLGKSVGHFRANSKALAELEADGIAKVSEQIAHCCLCSIPLYLSPLLCKNGAKVISVSLCGCVQVLFNKATDELLGVHIIGLHAADLIQECSNAMVAGTTVKQLAMMVSGVVSYILPNPAIDCM